jgi:predicted Zn-dependent protease
MEQQTDITQKALGLEVYVVQNAQGQFFRAKGYGGSGKTWVDDINQAKLYPNTRGARHAVTFFANAYPKLPAPVLLKLTIGKVEVINESDRLLKAKQRKEKAEAERWQRLAEYALERAKERMAAAEREMKSLQQRYGDRLKSS